MAKGISLMNGGLIGGRIRRYMEERRYSLVQLSEYSGLDVGRLNRFTHEDEKERWVPTTEEIDKIAKGLRVTAGHLLGTNTKPITVARNRPAIAAKPLPKREINPQPVLEDISQVELGPVVESKPEPVLEAKDKERVTIKEVAALKAARLVKASAKKMNRQDNDRVDLARIVQKNPQLMAKKNPGMQERDSGTCEKFRERLKYYREKNGLSGSCLSLMLGFERKYISRVECNHIRAITICELVKLSRILHVSPGVLLGEEEEEEIAFIKRPFLCMKRRLKLLLLKFVVEAYDRLVVRKR